MGNTALLLGLLLMVRTSTANPVPEIITTTSGMTWQTEVPDYPEKIAERLLHELESQNKIYNISNEQLSKMINNIKHEDEENNTTYTDLCSSRKRSIFPKGLNINNEQYYVLNPSSSQRQLIRTEICNHGIEGQQCQHLESVGFGYTTECIQEYITQTLYLMPTGDPEKLVARSISIESCCSCVIVNESVTL